MKSDTQIFKTISQFLVEVTNRLQKLSLSKANLSKDINYEINQFHELLKRQLNSTAITIKQFAQKYGLSKPYLCSTLFKQNSKHSSILSAQRLCSYLKISQQQLKKTYTTHSISPQKITQLISIVKEQIQILVQTKSILTQNKDFIQKLFEEIDFFNNKYINFASFAEFFNHYSGNSSLNKGYSETGCAMLIVMIKGYESSGEKLFLEDLIDFVERKDQTVEEYDEPKTEFNIVKKLLSKDSINFDCILQKSDEQNSSQIHNNSLQYKNSSRRSNFYHRQNFDQQYNLPFHNSSSSIGEEDMIFDLSISQSVSPRSIRSKGSFLAQEGTLNKKLKKNQKDCQKSSDHLDSGHKFTFQTKNANQTLFENDNLVEREKELIRVQHEYKVSERQKERQQKSVRQMSQRTKKSVFLEMSQQQKQKNKESEKQSFAIPSSPFKSFFHDHSSHISSALRQEKKLVYASSLTNNFESSLIRSHSRNLAYLSQVKLSDKSCPKIIQNCESVISNRGKNIIRPCLSNKVSVFQQKKVEFVFLLQSLGQEYARWYQVIDELIQTHDKFTFLSAFSVIDINESNEVKFTQFKEFLKDCEIQKKYEKIEFFFNSFSVFKGLPQKNTQNKENLFIQKLYQSKMHGLKTSKFEQKVMRYSDFLKIFYLQKTIPLIKNCKKRPVNVVQKWDENMRSSYCNFFRTVIDSCYEIQNTISSLKAAYKKMKETSQSQTFEKIFGKEIMRFDEMQKILGSNSKTLLCQISKNDQYIDEEKLCKFMSIDLNIQS